jgi:hypothetical chaperone protein
MRTALSFVKDPQLGASALQVEAGQAAIRAFIDNPGECRFLQSIKTFAASPLFQGTLIHGRRFQFEDLMEVFLKRLEIYAGDDWPSPVSRVVTGRPVHFAGARPDPDLAMQRYNEALTRLGFPELHYVYEPVAAAFYFAQNLKQDATVLVADFGGGTSDFSLIRFESRAGRISALPVGHSGVVSPATSLMHGSSIIWSHRKSARAASSEVSASSLMCPETTIRISPAGTRCRSSRQPANFPI